jgi:hypothetical protein
VVHGNRTEEEGGSERPEKPKKTGGQKTVAKVCAFADDEYADRYPLREVKEAGFVPE